MTDKKNVNQSIEDGFNVNLEIVNGESAIINPIEVEFGDHNSYHLSYSGGQPCSLILSRYCVNVGGRIVATILFRSKGYDNTFKIMVYKGHSNSQENLVFETDLSKFDFLTSDLKELIENKMDLIL